MKKILFLILTNFTLINCSFAQNAWFPYAFPNYSINADYVTKPSFINAETGYTLNGIGSGSRTIEVHKTINKGLSWTMIDAHFPTNQRTSSGVPSVFFINSSTGYIITSFQPAGLPTFNLNILKSIDNGSNWTSVGFISNVDNYTNLLNPRIEFINNNLGYIWYEKGMFRTYDGGATWTQILSTFGNVNGGFITKVAFDPSDANTFYIAGGLGFLPGSPVLYKTTDQGSNFNIIANGSQPVNNVRGIFDISIANANKLVFATSTGIAKYENGTFAFISEPLSSSLFFYYNIAAQGNKIATYLQFRGSTGNTNKILYSEDNFSSYNEVRSFALSEKVDEIMNKQSVFSYVSHNNSSATNKTFFYLKEINLSSNLLFDNINQTGTSTYFYLDDFTGIKSLNIPGNYSVLGGTMYYHVGYTNLNSGQQIFYKWQNGKLNPTSSEYIDNDDYLIQANYKTKNLSTDYSAISNATQSKSLRDSNGVINRIHTSLGGVFYSRSTDGGANYFTEEVVNSGTQYLQQYPEASNSDNNKNPSLCEIRNSLSNAGGAPVSAGYPLNNIASVWERFNTATGKTEIKTAIRYDNTSGYRDWYKYRKGNESNRSGIITDFASTSSFNSKPIIFCCVNPSLMNNPDNYTYVIPHLEPNGSETKLVVTTAALGNGVSITNNSTIATGNITDFAVVSSELVYPGLFTLHIVYKKDNVIYYKCSKVGIEVVTGGNYNFFNWPQIVNPNGTDVYTFNVSAGDGNITLRNTPDISIRNGKPIITYQGRYNQNIIYSQENYSSGEIATTLPPSTSITFYPIVVRYLISGSSWSSHIVQNSSGSNTQSDPNIEGCSGGNSYILSFRKNNLDYYQYVGLAGYHCEPASFSGIDAKLVRQSYKTPTGGAMLTTLSSENTLYRLGKQNIGISNVSNASEDGVYNNIKGVIDMNNTNYIFNLGPIIIQKASQINQPLFTDALNDFIPSTGVEFNEYLRSEPFTLNNGDTLILGTTANYIKEDKQDYYQLKYTVNLMNISNQQVEKVLFIDTVGVDDDVISEYYRGYVFTDLPELENNYYIQIVVEDASGYGSKYNYVGVYDGNDEVADRGGYNNRTNGVYVAMAHGRTPNNIIINVAPDVYSLSQNYPNPFNPSTTIKYGIPKEGLVQMKIYDISGREVMSLINENKVAGNYEVKFNASQLSSGIYFYRINAGEFVQTKRMVLVK